MDVMRVREAERESEHESGGMVLVAYAGPVRPAAALRDSVVPTDRHPFVVCQ